MTSGHLVANTQFTLFGDIYFGQFYDAGRKFVTYRYGEFFAAQSSLQVIDLYLEVVYQLRDEEVLAYVGRPSACIYVFVIFEGLEYLERKFRSFRYYRFAEVVGYALGSFSVDYREQFLQKRAAQFFIRNGVFGIQTFDFLLVRVAAFFVFYSARKQLFAYYHTVQRRGCFERCVFHVAGLVAEYGAKQFFFR